MSGIDRLSVQIKLMTSKGYDPRSMTAEEWMNLAIMAEETEKSMSPFDPSRLMFIEQRMDAERAMNLRMELDALQRA